MESTSKSRDGLLRSAAVFVTLLLMPYFVRVAHLFVAGPAGRHVGVAAAILVAAVALWSWRIAAICLIVLAVAVLSGG